VGSSADAAELLGELYRKQAPAAASGVRRSLHWPSGRFHQALRVLVSAELVDAAPNIIQLRPVVRVLPMRRLLERLIPRT
jgi:hypothetical protein